ncbi:proline dehydrogenase [Annulohypoxylon stygium]|nr:proline dehydrogenase [Annulohypoxylon stygium]
MAFFSLQFLLKPLLRGQKTGHCPRSLLTSNTSRSASTNTATVRAKLSSTQTTWPLRWLPNAALIRTVFLGHLFASPVLSHLGMKVLDKLADSRHPFLDPDRNKLLNRVLRPLIYNHFCAGIDPLEIRKTIASIKRVGYTGVILNYAREIIADELSEPGSDVDILARQIQHWLDGNLKTLSMLDRGDYIGIKYTGAGGCIASALTANEKPPKQFEDALDKLCQQAKAQGTRILVDAEQQVYQPTIDEWTIDVMRKYNQGGDALVLNTYQSYLKESRKVIRDHLEIAHKEGWTLGIKLVRGAYILNDIRERIHDTRSDTDASYNDIAHDLLTRSFDGISGDRFPDVKIFLAGHNADSIRRAAQLHKSLALRGLSPGVLEFGQLYGMADHVSGELLAQCEGLSKEQMTLERSAVPHVFKCVNWGTVRECLHFLMRRAAENQGAAERLRDGVAEARRELKARLFRTAR